MTRKQQTALNGGLLGSRYVGTTGLLPYQGIRRGPRALGCHHLENICGPIESECGYHLILVVERTNCKRIDVIWTVYKDIYQDHPYVDGVYRSGVYR